MMLVMLCKLVSGLGATWRSLDQCLDFFLGSSGGWSRIKDFFGKQLMLTMEN